jgi:hypothetical protein
MNQHLDPHASTGAREVGRTLRIVADALRRQEEEIRRLREAERILNSLETHLLQRIELLEARRAKLARTGEEP